MEGVLGRESCESFTGRHGGNDLDQAGEMSPTEAQIEGEVTERQRLGRMWVAWSTTSSRPRDSVRRSGFPDRECGESIGEALVSARGEPDSRARRGCSSLTIENVSSRRRYDVSVGHTPRALRGT